MDTVVFDTHENFKQLVAVGFTEKQAEVQIRAISKIFESKELATKTDLAIMQRDLELKISESKNEMLKWVVSLMLVQTGLIITSIKFIF